MMNSYAECKKQEMDTCWVGPHYFGCLSYADDIILLCPTKDGLQQMIRQCEQYGQEYGVMYNTKKSNCIMFSKAGKETGKKMFLYNEELKWINDIKYLGCYVSNDLGELKEIVAKKGDLIGRVNSMTANFGGAPTEVLKTLFTSQCSHLYGCQSWNLADKSTNTFMTTWNRCVRRVLNLPYRSHVIPVTFNWGSSCHCANLQTFHCHGESDVGK